MSKFSTEEISVSWLLFMLGALLFLVFLVVSELSDISSSSMDG